MDRERCKPLVPRRAIHTDILQDIALLQAYIVADEKICAELEAIRNKRFDYVANEFNQAPSSLNLTTQDCQNRYTALISGTAAPGAIVQHESRLEKSAFYDPYADPEQREENASKYKAHQKQRMHEHSLETQTLSLLRKQQKQMDLELEAANATAAAMQKRADLRAGPKTDSQPPTIMPFQPLSLPSSAMQAVMPPALTSSMPSPSPRARSVADVFFDDDETNATITALTRGAPPRLNSDEIGTDPRDIMHRSELMTLLLERGLPRFREKDTKDIAVRRLRDADEEATVAQLQKLLKKRKQPLHGSRPELIARLAEADARGSKKFKPRHIAILNRARLTAKIAGTRPAVTGAMTDSAMYDQTSGASTPLIQSAPSTALTLLTQPTQIADMTESRTPMSPAPNTISPASNRGTMPPPPRPFSTPVIKPAGSSASSAYSSYTPTLGFTQTKPAASPLIIGRRLPKPTPLFVGSTPILNRAKLFEDDDGEGSVV